MRVIAGTAKGRRLTGPPGLDTRPLTDRAKEALFSSLGPRVGDAAVLDLYAGSGSLGLEALSRGAASAEFVERDRSAIASLRQNVAAVGLGGTVHPTNVESFLDRTGDRFDLVFVDPPYGTDDATVASVLAAVGRVCAAGATVVLHRRRGGDPPDAPEGLHLEASRRYGDVELWRFIKEDR
jgi:16S rRNA (guanine966-N2)-methyltransferase